MSIAVAHLLSDLPPLPGLIFRYFQQASDYVGMAAVHEGVRKWDRVDCRSAREGVPTADDLVVTFPLNQAIDNPDLLIAEIDQKIVGYAHVLWRWTEVTGVRVYLHLGYLLPQWRGKGIGSAMLRWSQRRIRLIAIDEKADERATFATNVSSTEVEADALIRAAGYDDVYRLSDMVLEPILIGLLTPLPVGVTLRQAEPEHYHAIYLAWKDAFSNNWTSTPINEADYQEFLADYTNPGSFDPALWQIAWAGEEVVGLVLTQIRKMPATGPADAQEQIGIFAEVAVRRAWQRQGIARALMTRALVELRNRNITHVRLFTNAANAHGARSLYEDLGSREVKQHIFYRKLLSTD